MRYGSRHGVFGEKVPTLLTGLWLCLSFGSLCTAASSEESWSIKSNSTVGSAITGVYVHDANEGAHFNQPLVQWLIEVIILVDWSWQRSFHAGD